MLNRRKSSKLVCLFVILGTAIFLWTCTQPKPRPSPNNTSTQTAVPNTTTANKGDLMKEPLITHIYTADPSAHVFEGKVYIYPSHDLDHDNPDTDTGEQYDMVDYHAFSMKDMTSEVIDHGEILHVDDVPWAEQQMWAPDAAFKNGTYYFYFPAKDDEGIFRIGVATSQSPAGPFTAQPKPIPGSFSIDPCSFIDDDGQAYLYFGGLWGGQLEKWASGSFEEQGVQLAAADPALGPRVARLTSDMLHFDGAVEEINITDENGQPLLAGDTARRYFEGPWVHKYHGTYYLSYSTGDTHFIAYATSKSPTGPFVFRGYILTPVIGWTTHHSIVEVEGKWYLFYHDSSLSGGASNKRCVKVTELFYDKDGTIQTIEP